MNNKMKYVIYIIVFIVIIVLLNIGYEFLLKQEEPKQITTSQGEKKLKTAFDFKVYDKDNNPIKVSDFKGKPIIINFWATWCSYCVQEMPEFNEIYEQEKDNVVFMMVNATDGRNETKEKAYNYIKNSNYTFPVYYDTSYEAIETYGITGFPTTIFINKDFEVVSIYQSMLTKQSLQQYINKIKER